LDTVGQLSTASSTPSPSVSAAHAAELMRRAAAMISQEGCLMRTPNVCHQRTPIGTKKGGQKGPLLGGIAEQLRSVHPLLEAAETLAREGMEIEVVDLRTPSLLAITDTG
jgi:pyruvate/2-oxoglutarate/acetoin dehydrogenase E1 component